MYCGNVLANQKHKKQTYILARVGVMLLFQRFCF